jgi:hypothetical protein
VVQAGRVADAGRDRVDQPAPGGGVPSRPDVAEHEQVVVLQRRAPDVDDVGRDLLERHPDEVRRCRRRPVVDVGEHRGDASALLTRQSTGHGGADVRRHVGLLVDTAGIRATWRSVGS